MQSELISGLDQNAGAETLSISAEQEAQNPRPMAAIFKPRVETGLGGK